MRSAACFLAGFGSRPIDDFERERELTKRTALGIVLGAVLVCGARAGASSITLVSEGRAEAVIVAPDAASRAAVEGAGILQSHLEQISGARLRVLSEKKLGRARVADGRIVFPADEAVAETFVLVGEGALARKLGVTSEGLGPGGIVMQTVGNTLVLLGADDKTPSDALGSRYAVTTFLEEQLGCRYLWPGESGKVVPRQKTIAVRPLNVRFTPMLRQRNIRWSGYSSRIQMGLSRLRFTKEDFQRARAKASATQAESPDWMGWHGMGGTLGLRTGDGTILPAQTWDRFLREHPEWFAMQADGSRYFDPNWERPRLCKSNPALIEAIVREKLKELKANPGRKSISLMTNDGGGKAGFCMCGACKALDPPEGRPTNIWTYDHKAGRSRRFNYVSLTDRMLYFYNAIAEKVGAEYPNVLFTGQAYSVYASPPVRQKLHPRIVIRFVHNTAHYASDEIRRQGMSDWDAWADSTSMIYWRPNSLLWGRHEGITGVYVHKLAEDFAHIAHNKCVGTDFDSCMHHWATQGLNYYVLAKLHWDPDLDVENVIDDYCRSGFGRAANEIRRYMTLLERLTDRTAAKKRDTIDRPSIDVTEPYTPAMVAELRDILDAADKAAGDNAIVRRRIGFLRRGLELTAIQSRIYEMNRLAGQRRRSSAEWEQARRLQDEKLLMMRSIFEDEHFAVNVAAMCWGELFRLWRLPGPGPSPRATQADIYRVRAGLHVKASGLTPAEDTKEIEYANIQGKAVR